MARGRVLARFVVTVSLPSLSLRVFVVKSGLAPRQGCPHASLRAQREGGPGYDLFVSGKREAEFLDDKGQDEHHLHHGEGVADAQAWPAAEGEVRKLGEVFHTLRVPALGT